MTFGLFGSSAMSVTPLVPVANNCVKLAPLWRHRPLVVHATGNDEVGQPTAPPVTELTPRMALARPTSRLPSLSNASAPTARSLKIPLPGISDQVLPPSADL